MAGEAASWDAIPLDDLTEEETPITYGVVKPGEEGEVKFVRGGDIAGGRVLMDQLRTIGRDVSQQYRRTLLRGGEILVSLVGNPGQIAIAPPSLAGANIARQVGLVRLKPGIDTRFVSYFLQSRHGQTALGAQSLGSVQQVINLRDLKRIKVSLPPLAEQNAIVAVLGTLDDRIELNRRMNSTLEAMARALFQSWFVDFDPVRAKLDGRKPKGLDESTAALFPNHLDESLLGHIPKGWRAGTIEEGFNLTMGQSPPGDTYNAEGNGLPFYQGRTDFGFRFPTRRIFCTAPTRYAKPGDTLVSVRAPVGDINMANEECCIGRGIAAVHHKSGATSFTYHSMANLYPDFARFEGEGTVFGSINKDSFEKLRFVIPPDKIVAAYECTAGPIDQQIRILEEQSRTLATLRDTLLPKLLSGELSVDKIKEGLVA